MLFDFAFFSTPFISLKLCAFMDEILLIDTLNDLYIEHYALWLLVGEHTVY